MPVEITRDAFYSIAEVSQLFGISESELFQAARATEGGLKVAEVMGTHYVRGDHLIEYLEGYLIKPGASAKATGQAPALPNVSSHSQISGILRTGEYEDPLSSEPGVPATERQIETPSDPANKVPEESDLKLYNPGDRQHQTNEQQRAASMNPKIGPTPSAFPAHGSQKSTEKDQPGISSSTGKLLIPKSDSEENMASPDIIIDPPSSGRYDADVLMEEMERYQRESDSGGIETASGKTGERRASDIDDTWL